MVCAVYHDMHDDDSGMWTKKESGEEKIGKRGKKVLTKVGRRGILTKLSPR